jgi:hypothetical protein
MTAKRKCAVDVTYTLCTGRFIGVNNHIIQDILEDTIIGLVSAVAPLSIVSRDQSFSCVMETQQELMC